MAKRSRAPATPNPESGRRLRQFRLAKQMTQGELAGERYSVSYISAIERGQARPSLGVLEWCAQRLGIPVQDLLPPPPDAAMASGQAGQRIARAAYEQVRAKLATSAGRFAQARALLTQLRAHMGDMAAPALVWYSALVTAAMGEAAKGRADAEQFAHLADQHKDERERAAAQLLMGLLHADAQEPDRAIEALRAALSLASNTLVDLDFRLVATSKLAMVLAERRAGHEAGDVLGQAVEAYEWFTDPSRRAAEAERLAEEAAAGGDFLHACMFGLWAWMSQRVLNAERTGARLYLVRAMLAGEATAVERERDARHAHELAKATGDEATRLVAAAYVVATLGEAREAERARRAADELGLEELEQLGDAPALARGVVSLAHGWLAYFAGEPQRAVMYAGACQEALDAEHEAARPELASAYAGLAELYSALDDAQRASAALRRAVRHDGRRLSL